MSERLVRHRGDFIPSYKLTPTRQHQASEELLKLEKEFASLIYRQKDWDRR